MVTLGLLVAQHFLNCALALQGNSILHREQQAPSH